MKTTFSPITLEPTFSMFQNWYTYVQWITTIHQAKIYVDQNNVTRVYIATKFPITNILYLG